MLFTHSETLSSQTPPAASQRSGAVWSVGRALSLFSRAGGAIWRHLEDVGQERANREMRLHAACWAVTAPELASHLPAAGTFDARSQAARANRELHLLAARP